jgi:hypothetical protein
MALGSSQPLTEMSTMNLRRLRLATSQPSELIVCKMWEPRRLTTLWAYTACYRDSFTLLT